MGECYNVSYTNFKVIRNQPVSLSYLQTLLLLNQLISFLLMVNKAFLKIMLYYIL